jgi:diguanylate cyclase (GGDEF)-like protein/PAS domain S-box-containing protein
MSANESPKVKLASSSALKQTASESDATQTTTEHTSQRVNKDQSPSTATTPSSASLKRQIFVGFVVVTLAYALLLVLVIVQLSDNQRLPQEATSQIKQILLMGGFAGTLLALLLGGVIASKIANPMLEYAEELKMQAGKDVPWNSKVHRDYAELEVLSGTLHQLATDIHEREHDLRESERKFREAFDLVGIGLTQVNMQGEFIIVNRRFCEMLGYSREELIGKSFVEITHPDDQEADLQLVKNAGTQHDLRISKEKRYIRKDGSILWAQRSGVIVRDATGKPQYGLGSIEDVSQYHASQETLRALNASLKAIVQTSPLAIISVTPTGAVTLWNPAAEHMFGISEMDVLGKPSPLATRGSAEKMKELRARVLAGETVHEFEVGYLRKTNKDDETNLNISIAAAPLLGTQNSVVGVLLTCTDITNMRQTAQRLDEQLRFTQELLEVMPNPIFYKGVDGRYQGFNRAWENYFNLKRDEWVGKSYADVFSDEDVAFIKQEDQEIMAGRQIVREVQVKDGRGQTRDTIKHISRINGPDGKPAGMIGLLTDITDFKQVTKALEASEIRFRALTESAMDIVSVLDADGVIRYQSPSLKHLLGYEPSELVGRSQFDVVHHEDVELMRQMFNSLVIGGDLARPVEFRVRAKDGSWRILESIGKNCLDVPEVRGIIVNTRDVTERRAIQERIQHLAFHDALTGLPNRSLMQDRITQSIARAERALNKCAVMFIDIDNFKNINDTLGHDAGDDLLCEVAKRLRDSVRNHDTIARQGGDEFIVLLDQLDGHQGATRVAQKILDAMRRAFSVGGQDQHVSGSVGIAMYPDDGRDAQTLLKNADTAMFHGKALGKNTYQFFTSQMNIAVKRRAAMESNLRAAVKNEDFSLVYQPQIDLITGEVVALEALVRWNSTDSGTMMPGEFIPLAEETGLINELGAWVLKEACQQNKRWQDAGYAPRRMAVNLSAKQLADKGFMEMLASVLRTTGLAAEYLELEITESQVMRQGEGSVMMLNEIAEMGIQLAVDDFGTGYSSLSYLKRLPIGKLKIDQSFIRDITVDPNDTAIVVAIINMAKSLDLDIIAEGVETAGQLTLLRAKGCSVGQGYYFSVPLDAQGVEALFERDSLFDSSTTAVGT